MNIFGNLFNNFFYNRNKSYITKSSLVGMQITCDNFIYNLFVAKRLYAPYKEAIKRAEKNKKLSAMDKTRIDGYLNPKYHFATYLRKRIH